MYGHESTVHERLRADACVALFWASLNGSEADAMRASDPGTRAIAGDPECKDRMLPGARRMRDRATDQRLAALRAA